MKETNQCKIYFKMMNVDFMGGSKRGLIDRKLIVLKDASISQKAIKKRYILRLKKIKLKL